MAQRAGAAGQKEHQTRNCLPPFSPLAMDKAHPTDEAGGFGARWEWQPIGTDQHASPPEAHHAQTALEREAVVVGGGDTRLERLGSANTVSFLGLPLRVMHPLHMLP